MRPAEALDHHAAILAYARTDKAVVMWRDIATGQRMVGRTPVHESPQVRARFEARTLELASTYWCSVDMASVASAAATTMPAEPALASDFPCATGILFFERGLPFFGQVDAVVGLETQVLLSAFRWHITDDGIVSIVCFEDAHDERSLLGPARTPAAWQALPRHSPIYDDFEVLRAPGLTLEELDAIEARAATAPPVWRMVRATISLLGQTLAVTTPTTVDRASRRRAKEVHADLAERPVRVVTLRRARNPSDTNESTNAEWSHRWLVQGHWRRQWLPSRQEHRLTWIHPFVKGPEDKPFVAKQTVNALRR